MHTKEDWIAAFQKLIDRYKDNKHVLVYQNLYQILVMVVLSAQDSDAKINGIATELFKAFPNMSALSKASTTEIVQQIKSVRGHLKKAAWLQEIAHTVKSDKNIPTNMKQLTDLKGIGRKSANVVYELPMHVQKGFWLICTWFALHLDWELRRIKRPIKLKRI